LSGAATLLAVAIAVRADGRSGLFPLSRCADGHFVLWKLRRLVGALLGRLRVGNCFGLRDLLTVLNGVNTDRCTSLILSADALRALGKIERDKSHLTKFEKYFNLS
jgi:hypothetical protein